MARGNEGHMVIHLGESMEELSIAITAPAKSDREKSALGNV